MQQPRQAGEATTGSDPADGARPALAETAAPYTAAHGISPLVFAGLVRLFEALLVGSVGALAIHFYIPAGEALKPAYGVAVPGVALASILTFQTLGLYRIAVLRDAFRHGPSLAFGFGLVFLALMALVFFLKLGGVFSRGVIGLWFLFGLAALIAGRLAVSALVRRLLAQGIMERRAAIVGGGEHAESLIDALVRAGETDIQICGVFDERDDLRSPDLVAGYPKLGNIDDLVAYARVTRLDLIIFSLPVTAEARILTMLQKLWVLPVDIRLAAHMQKLRFRPRNYSYIGTLPMFDVADKPFNDWDVLVKAAFDRVIGAVLLLLLSPVMLAVAVAVRLDSPGPVLFRQKRYGFNNQLIEVFKFRSMYADRLDPAAGKLVTRDDPRVTRVGRFIRRTSLDELPQLINVVVRGDLSLVGPRPHAVHARAEDRLYDEVVDGYFARHKVKPGITGWAQINGWRGETDTAEKIQRRVEHDLHYIENWSVLFDLYILALTPVALFDSRGAY